MCYEEGETIEHMEWM
jgi:hypothetical protein